MPNYTFKDPEGTTWASQHEYRVYDALRQLGAPVRRTVPGSGDTFSYQERQQRVHCLECGSTSCVQERKYTPDLHMPQGDTRGVIEDRSDESYFIEAKGYFRPDKRTLFRAFRKGRPEVDIRLVVQRNHKVGKGTIMTWAKSYAKVEAWQWDYNKDDVVDVIPSHWINW